jgi:hypothetical protein
MGSTFNVLKVRRGGSLRITTVAGLREAKVQMARFAVISPGEYFVQSQEKSVVARQSKSGPTSFDIARTSHRVPSRIIVVMC